MKLRIWSFVLATLLGIPLGRAAEHTQDSLDKVRENLAKKLAVLIDVREKSEWDRGHLQEAQLFPLGELKRAGRDPAVKQKVEKGLPKDRIVYCHCAKGVRALMAAEILERLGYDVRPLAAGYDKLREANFPVATDDSQ
jgi:phage shock protein E